MPTPPIDATLEPLANTVRDVAEDTAGTQTQAGPVFHHRVAARREGAARPSATFPHDAHARAVRAAADLAAALADLARHVTPATSNPVTDHLEATCSAAGLESMARTLQFVRDRQSVPDATWLSLTPSDVTWLYEQHVGPAVDGLEDELLRHAPTTCALPGAPRPGLS